MNTFISNYAAGLICGRRLGWALGVWIALASAGMAQVAPVITSVYIDTAVVPTGTAQTQYGPNLLSPAYSQPAGPGEFTNATQIYAQFVSNSLGHTNLSDATAHTGFNMAGGSVSSITGLIDPPPNGNTNNPFFYASGTVQLNQAWLLINFIPGTDSTAVTNTLRLIAVNGNNNQTTNWVMTNLYLVVQPPPPLPPHLEVRFYNRSTNSADQVFILPTCKGLAGCGFWWSNGIAADNWTNWMMTTTNMTVSLADIGISGTNVQGHPYYSIYLTNFPNAAWFVSYGGGNLRAPTNSSGKWDGITTYGAGPNRAQPTSSNTNGLWFGYEWNAFELTLDGNPEDVGDTTYINQFSIPMAMRVFTNTPADAHAGIYTNRDSSLFYQIGGWTNYTRSDFSNLVSQMLVLFSNGVIKNASGVPVMTAGPSAAGNGTLAPPWGTQHLADNSQNAWPSFSAYFEAVKQAQPGRQARIKDFIGLSGGAGLPTYFFYYDFALTVTASNSLRLDGSMLVTNAPGSGGTFFTNASNLMLEIAADGGPCDNWASWSIYTAPTPANLTVAQDLFSLTNGAHIGLTTNLTTYTPYATNGLCGTEVHLTGSNFLGAVQVLFCGPAGNALLPAAYTVLSDSNITVHVPYDAQTGPIIVTTEKGSGKTAGNFTISGTTAQTGPSFASETNAPVVHSFTPASGSPASPICEIDGDWLGIAGGTQTGPGHGGSRMDLYNSAFGSAVMGRIAGDLAAGFAFGFINSAVTNPAYAVNGTNQPYGDSPSGSWWGGNEFTAADTNRLAYHQVNTNYSVWGNLIYSATAVTYAHPIYDRMKIYGGGYTREVIQPMVAVNGTPNIWMAEFDFYDGMSAVHQHDTQDVFHLLYRGGAGGAISGAATQYVNAGESGSPVQAVGADTSVVFHAWSDGRRDNPRTDSNVLAGVDVTARFRSRGGADLDWYAQYGYSPAVTQEWSDLDIRPVPAKASVLLEQCFADTDPADTAAVFRVVGIQGGRPAAVSFTPSSTGRLYSLLYTGDLIHGPWTNVPGTSPRPGTGAADTLTDTNAWANASYRIRVDMPQ